VDAHAVVRIGRAVAAHGVQAIDEIGGAARQRQRVPAQLVGRHCAVREIAVQVRLRIRAELTVRHRRADPVQPATPVAAARRGERGARQLFGIQPMRHPLRRVAAHRQRAGHRLGGELIAETGLVTVG